MQHYNRLRNFAQKNRKVLLDLGTVKATRLIQKLLSLATIVVLVRTISQEDYGEYSFVISIAALCSVFSLGGIGNSLIQSISRGFKGTYLHSMKYTIGGSFIASLVLACFSLYWYLFKGETHMAIAFIIIAGLIPFANGMSYWKSVMSGEERFQKLSVITFVTDIIKNISIICSILFLDQAIFWPVLASFLVSSIANVAMTYFTVRSISKEEKIEKDSMAYGIRTTFYSCFNTVANKVDAVLIFTFLSPVSLAIYAIADRLSEIVKDSVNDIGVVLMPKLARKAEYTRQINKIIKIFSLSITAIIIFCAFTILPYAMEILFGQEYLESIPYAQVLIISVALAVFHNLKFRYIVSQLDGKSYRDFSIVTSLARIILSIILVPIIGLWGAVISAFFYRIVSICYVEYLMRTRYEIKS